MKTNYNSNLYLTPNDLNTIENKIEEVTNKIKMFVFSGAQSSLTHIQTNDRLGGKTLYLSFPRDIYENITSGTEIDILKTDENNKISYVYKNNIHNLYFTYNGVEYELYSKSDENYNPGINFIRYELPFDFGSVTEINDSDNFYQYIQIYRNEYIIPNYNKKTWSINNVPTMKDLDNIERGIRNIGYYFYKPNGWQKDRDWLPTGKINRNNNDSVATKNISYLDLNRWGINLNLINSYKISDLSLWNTDASQIYWDTESDVEWEDL